MSDRWNKNKTTITLENGELATIYISHYNSPQKNEFYGFIDGELYHAVLASSEHENDFDLPTIKKVWRLTRADDFSLRIPEYESVLGDLLPLIDFKMSHLGDISIGFRYLYYYRCSIKNVPPMGLRAYVEERLTFILENSLVYLALREHGKGGEFELHRDKQNQIVRCKFVSYGRAITQLLSSIDFPMYRNNGGTLAEEFVAYRDMIINMIKQHNQKDGK